MNTSQYAAFKNAMTQIEQNPSWVKKAEKLNGGMLSIEYYVDGGGKGATYMQYWAEPLVKYSYRSNASSAIFNLLVRLFSRAELRLYSPVYSKVIDVTIDIWRVGKMRWRFMRLWKQLSSIR